MKRYVATFVGLLLLTALTFGLAFLDLGGWDTSVAMAIGGAKSLLIVLWFMHLVEHRNSGRLALAVGVALALVLIAFTVMDVRTRRPERSDAPSVGALVDR